MNQDTYENLCAGFSINTCRHASSLLQKLKYNLVNKLRECESVCSGSSLQNFHLNGKSVNEVSVVKYLYLWKAKVRHTSI